MSTLLPHSTQIDLLRHGEPVGGRRYRGQIDDPLSDRGWQQMRAAVTGTDRWDVIYSSPLVRCRAFAEELAARQGAPLQVDDRLKEIGFGAWEGRSADELRAQDPLRIERFWRDPVGNRPENAETLESFRSRVSAAWQEILNTHPGKRLLIVGHAGITRMILCIALQFPLEHLFRIRVDNAGMTRLRIQGEGADAYPILQFHGNAASRG